ncbi:MAG: amidohydrolase [Candidatus Phytoplasma sp.]|nr:amidohydrolase [Phytoplasma sp.]
MKIIDAHAHIVEYINGYGSQGELRAIGDGYVQYATGQTFKMFPEGFGPYQATPEQLLEVMNKNNVSKAVLLQGMYLGFQNLYTYEAMVNYPDRFIGAASLDPYTRNKDKIITHLFDELKFKIIKMELSTTSGLMANHTTIDLDGKMMHEIYQMANLRNLIFVIDIGRPFSDSYQIDQLRKVCLTYPKMKFVLCHLGAHQINQLDLLTENLTKLKLDNLYFDLAAVPNNTKPEKYPYTTAQKYIRKAIDILGNDKIMWGSDMPAALNYDTYENMINYLKNSDLFTKEELLNLFYENANRLYFDGK